MIKGTFSECKIQSITVTNSTALLHCIIYSSVPAEEQKAFKFYIRDKENPKKLISASENIYWIDRLNNYNNDSINIDVNQYLAFTIAVDITNKNTSSIIENKWVRKCNLVIKNMKSLDDADIAWISEDLVLISKEFEIPEIINLDIRSDNDWNLIVSYKLNYKSQQDFSYNDQNIYTTINVESITGLLLETKDILDESISNSISTIKFDNKYDSPIIINILLKNASGYTIKQIVKHYKPVKRRTNTYVKTQYGIKKVLAFYIKGKNNGTTI